MKDKKISLIILIIIMLVSTSCSLLKSLNPPDKDEGYSNVTNQGNQSDISLPDGASLKLEQGSLSNDSKVSIELISKDKGSYDEFNQVGSLYEISFGGAVLDSPATLTLPYDPESLPEDVDPETLFIAYYDEDAQDWQFVGGDVDTENHLITVKTDHASRWSVFDWNFDAWIAILDKTLSGSIVSWVEAADLLTDDCPQSGVGVWVDSTKSGNMIQGCIEEEDETEVVLRVVNPKSFYYEITADAEEHGIEFSKLLSPGGSYEFTIDKLDPPPVEVRAIITQEAGVRLVIHMILKMLPGFNALPNQSKIVACVTERLKDASYFWSMAEELYDADDNTAYKIFETFKKFTNDEDAVRRFLTATDDCTSGLSSTWSPDKFSLILSTSSVIIEGWDFIMNYAASANRSPSQVIFHWTQLGPKMEETILPTDDDVVSLGDTGSGQILYIDNQDLYLLDINSGESKLIVEEKHIIDASVSPNGQYLAYTSQYEDSDMGLGLVGRLEVLDLENSQPINLTNVPEDVNSFIWSPESGHITVTRRNYRYCYTFQDKQISGLYDYNINSGELINLESSSDQYVLSVCEWSPNHRYLLYSTALDCSSGVRNGVYDSNTGVKVSIPLGSGTWASQGDTLLMNEVLYYGVYHDVPLMEYNIPTEELKALVEKPGYFAMQATESATGEWVAISFSATDEYNPEPWLLNKIDGELTQIGIQGGWPQFWDPTGSKLVVSVSNFISRNESITTVYLFNPSTSEIKVLLENISGRALEWVIGK